MTKLKRNIRSSQGLTESMGFSMLPHSHSAIAITNRLTGSQFRLWHYLMMVDPFADQTRNGEKIYHPIPSPAEIAVAIGASQRTVEKDMKRLEELGLLPGWVVLKTVNYSDVERQIRDRLKAELGGQVEVVTAVGRIDLLTESEVIEIKNINDWKGALGQILAYSAFFPEHGKRIHLFGKADLAKLALAQGTCSEFEIIVTFEEV